MLSLVGAALSGLIGFGTDWLKGKQAITKAKATSAAKLIQTSSDNGHAWDMAQIRAVDLWLRRACFAIFSVPLAWDAINPDAVTRYYQALANVPGWWKEAFLGMVAAIWGLHGLGHVAGIVKAKGQ